AMVSNLSPFLIALVVVLVLSASMSTLSSLVMTSASTLIIDFWKTLFCKKMEDKKQLFWIRVLIVVFIAISAVIAMIQYKSSVKFIAQMMGISWGALAGAFLAPFLYGLYWKKASKAACWTSFLFGTIVMSANTFVPQIFPELFRSPIHCGVLVMLAGLVIVPVVSMFTKKPDPQFVNDAFACYE
ncbi:MAG: sodium:solute symporter, partial [Evtepia sp.]